MSRLFEANSTNGNAVNHTDCNDLLKNAVKKKDTPGFDEDYRDVADYILLITHRIWEERSVGVIYDTYHNECRVRGCSTAGYGVRDVILHTLGDQHAFLDRHLAPQAVIWSEDQPGQYFSSHRSLSTSTHLGAGRRGSPSGRSVTSCAIADRYIKENRIYEEWLVRDAPAQMRCIGIDPLEYARRLPAPEHTSGANTAGGICESMEGQFYPEKYTAKDDSIGEKMLELHSQVFNYKSIDRVCDFFAEDAVMYYVGGECLKGHDKIQGALIGLLCSFASGSTVVQRVTVNHCGDGSADVAVRWILQGIHEGYGMFGVPTRKSAEIMDSNHYRWERGRIQDAWMIFNVLDILCQLHGSEAEEEAGEA